jgi:hypothetical protein
MPSRKRFPLARAVGTLLAFLAGAFAAVKVDFAIRGPCGGFEPGIVRTSPRFRVFGTVCRFEPNYVLIVIAGVAAAASVWYLTRRLARWR